MKMNKLFGSLVAIFAGVMFFAPAHTLAAAFGVSPPWIENNNLKPGSNFVYLINLSANDLPGDMIVRSELEGDPEITEWLTIRGKDNLVMTTGQNIVPMSVDVNVPADAKVGKYQGNLKLSLSPKNGNHDNIAALLGGNIAIKLSVVDYNVTDYWVQTISADPITEGQAIDLKLSIKNLGNTDITSVMTNLSVVDMKTGTELISGSSDRLNKPVAPNTMANAEIAFLAPDLKAGNYWLDVESFKDNQSVYKNRLFFTVNPSTLNNTVKTAVEVNKEGRLKPAASAENQLSPNTNVKTSVRVRAPLTNQLIGAIIFILLVLTGVVIKLYVVFKKRHR